MEQASARLTIGAFAAAAGVNVETVRYYQRKGLLSEPDKPYGGIRRYGDPDVARVKFIKSAQRLGFSLDEVAALLALDDGMHCKQAQQLAEHKLDGVRAKLADLRRIETVLEGLVRQCARSRGRVSCPLVDALHDSASGQRDLADLPITHVRDVQCAVGVESQPGGQAESGR